MDNIIRDLEHLWSAFISSIHCIVFVSWKKFSILLKLGIISLKTKVQKKDQKLKQGTYVLQTKKMLEQQIV
jgi:hypothetical protein